MSKVDASDKKVHLTYINPDAPRGSAPEKPTPTYIHPENLIDWLMLV